MIPTFIENDFISKTDHELAIGYIADDFEQLMAELYDDCQNIDTCIVHELICDLCEKLNMTEIPDIKALKINKGAGSTTKGKKIG